MKLAAKKVLVVLIAVAFVLGAGLDPVRAAVGSLDEGEDVAYDKAGGVLKSLGFDTSEMPKDYDPDATTNPYGSDVTTVNEIEEIYQLDKDSRFASLFGHNAKLDGEYSTLAASEASKAVNYIDHRSFTATAKCDINGNGRASALAMVYTNYDHPVPGSDKGIYMRIIDPTTGKASDPFTIGAIPDTGLPEDYLIQSQLQVTAGDYDKDAVDEIAVYVPAKNTSSRAKVTVFDLIDGKDCEDPYSKSEWRSAWNYVLPVNQDSIIQIGPTPESQFARNVYNSVDLTSGDADNDGISDLIVSYGASDTDIHTDIGHMSDPAGKIFRSIPSTSILLYGNDKGQMLKESQQLPYGNNELIRVAFAFGDVNGDGNEDMFIGGQLRAEQYRNTSRVLGQYHYDTDSGKMELEAIKNMEVVSGTQGQDKYYSNNGWDGIYTSAPLMKVNIAIGDVLGQDNAAKIYMDSVLYSADEGDFSIVEELEDTNKGDDHKPVGSQIFADMKGYNNDPNEQARYYEFGADAGNFTGGFCDYMLVERVSVNKKSSASGAIEHNKEAATSIICQKMVDDQPQLDVKHKRRIYDDISAASPYFTVAVDTDKDSMVATYTGEHDIDYKDPELLAVLVSPPYYKDVAAYDGNDMLNYCGTSYSKKTGDSVGEAHSYSGQLGAFLNFEIGADKGARFMSNLGFGWARSETWGFDEDREYEISYSTVGGEDAVVLYSKPCENYMYKLEGITVDDDGNFETFTQDYMISKEHIPVKQVLTLEDYNDIQKRHPKEIPDVSELISSEAGHPETYPKSENDIPEKAKEHLDKNNSNFKKGYRIGDDWSGVSYGGGAETQTFSYTKTSYDNVEDGTYLSAEVGVNNAFGIIGYWQSLQLGGHYDYTRTGGDTASTTEGHSYSGTVVNMPVAAKGYGYNFAWKLFSYDIKYSRDGKKFEFPVVTYLVNDTQAPPTLPDNIVQDYEKTTDSQLALKWDYSGGNPKEFVVYRYEDFPIGGGDTPIGTVSGDTYKVKKDENGNTVKDKRGRVVREYSFTDTGLTPDTKYRYRIKAIGNSTPRESIFSPPCEARTFVGTRPEISLSADSMTIYPDGTYDLLAKIKDPENYQSNISYQWQKYDEKKRKWVDLDGRTKAKLHFYNCEDDDAGRYRCRMNLIRKVEGHPQYISEFTDSCEVTFALRDVKFGDIRVSEGTGNASTNTAVSVDVFNKSESSLAKPVGSVVFTVTGPNGTFKVVAGVDEDTGHAEVPSIEDRIGTVGQKDFVPGGYVITASYAGSALFYQTDDPEEYHYLRGIGECEFLSLKSIYYYGEDIMETAGLFDYKQEPGGKVSRKDITEDIKYIKFYAANGSGQKVGDSVKEYKLEDSGGKAIVPLCKDLTKWVLVEAYKSSDGSGDPAATTVFKVKKIDVRLDFAGKMTGTGDLLEFVDEKDIKIGADVDIDINEKNIETGTDVKSLADCLLFKYYELNGEYICSSTDTESHKDEFIPADYLVRVMSNDDIMKKFYTPVFSGGEFIVVSNYYKVSASAKDPNTGNVEMISPDKLRNFSDQGYAGGTKLTLKAVPDNGFKVSKWLVDECGVREYTLPGTEKLEYAVRNRDTEGDGKIRIRAVMEPKENKLEFGVKGQGTVRLEPSGIGSGDIVLAGTGLKFTATPAPGWKFDEWRWTNVGGNDIVSGGAAQDDGTNTKTFTMPDNSAVLYAVFKRNTIDVMIPDDVELLYINDGSDPLSDIGAEIMTDRGREVPKGVQVIVRLKQGMELAPGAKWMVTANGEGGMIELPVTGMTSAGRPACKFKLEHPLDPSVDLETCLVSIDTMKGRYTVQARNEFDDRVDFAIFVDGNEMDGNPVSDIEAGSQIDVKAKARRGYRINYWNVNGNVVEAKDDTYSGILTGNTIVQTATERDEEVSLKVKAEGGGKGKYVITDKNGDTIEGTVEGTDETVVSPGPYKGESVVLSAADDEEEFTMTAVTVNGEDVELEDGKAEIKELNEDTEVVLRFRPNTYYDVDFTKVIRTYDARIFDEAGGVIDDGEVIKAGKGEDLDFSVVIDKDSSLVVEASGGFTGRLEPAGDPVLQPDGKSLKYSYTLTNFKADTHVTIFDHNIRYISNERELLDYFEELAANENNPERQPDGVLTDDIKMTTPITGVPRQYAGTFDGQGHGIWGLSVGSADGYIKDFYGLFGNMLRDPA